METAPSGSENSFAPSGVSEDFATVLKEKGVAKLDLTAEPGIFALCDEVIEDQHFYSDAGFNRLQDLWRRSPAARRMAGLKPILESLEQAYTARPFPFQTLNFHFGSEQHPSCDVIHCTPDPPRFLCGVLIALEDIGPDSGPPVFFPGSHREPVLSLTDAGAPPGMAPREAYVRFYEPEIARRAEAYPREIGLLRKGEAYVWHANLIHGETPIADKSVTRRSMTIHYFFEGCDYYTLMTSPPGRRRRRLPSDARTGRFVWPKGGMPDAYTIAFELWARLSNRVYPFTG